MMVLTRTDVAEEIRVVIRAEAEHVLVIADPSGPDPEIIAIIADLETQDLKANRDRAMIVDRNQQVRARKENHRISKNLASSRSQQFSKLR